MLKTLLGSLLTAVAVITALSGASVHAGPEVGQDEGNGVASGPSGPPGAPPGDYPSLDPPCMPWEAGCTDSNSGQGDHVICPWDHCTSGQFHPKWPGGNIPDHSRLETLECHGNDDGSRIYWTCLHVETGNVYYVFTSHVDGARKALEIVERRIQEGDAPDAHEDDFGDPKKDTNELADCGDESGVHQSTWEPEPPAPTVTEQYYSSGSLSWGDSYHSGLAGSSDDPYGGRTTTTTTYAPYGGRASYSPYAR